MKIFNSKIQISQTIVNLKLKGYTIGFVPTMGALHQGHLALVSQALRQNQVVIVSVFVNPTQFDKKQDLIKYPRNINTDVALLKTVSEDNILVFAPSVDEIYGHNVSSICFDFDGLEHEMEGRFRDGHFNGVGTIIKRFFEILKPNNAYFGEKDFQQLQIIKKLTEKEKLPVNVIGCEIYREPSGLAMSSRNQRLTKHQQTDAAFIYKTLKDVKMMFATKSINDITQWVSDAFKKQASLHLEYFTIADISTLKPVQTKSSRITYRAFIAVFIKDIRLIDNIAL